VTPFVLVSCDLVKTGGMDRANFALASYLARQGHSVLAVSHHLDDELREQGVRFCKVAKPLGSYLLGEWLLRRKGKAIAQNGARVIANGGNCPTVTDTNWVHYVHAAYQPTVATGFLRRCKHAVSHRSFLAAEATAMQNARIIIVNSRRTKRDLIERLDVPEDRIHVVYYGIDSEIFRPATESQRPGARTALGWNDSRPTAVFIGALGDRRKGFDTLLEAWRLRCADRIWDARLVVVGHGAELPRWRQLVLEMGLADSVTFLGFRHDVPLILQACDVMIHPARYEAFGLGVYEALCCGVPAIVSSNAGVAERFSPELSDLLLPDAEDVNDLADRLAQWRRREEFYRRETLKLSQTLRQRDWDTMANEIVHIMLHGHAPQPGIPAGPPSPVLQESCTL
jgi:glycosyltransferase involved in cell wall biosynthesis